MISIIVGVIVGICFFVSMKKGGEKPSFVEIALMGFVGLFVTEMIGTIVFFITMTSNGAELVSSQQIVALADDSSISESHFLGCGSHNSSDYYIYYAEEEHGYKRHKINATQSRKPVYINYIFSNETPHVDTYSAVTCLKKKPSVFVSIVPYLICINKAPGDFIGDPSRFEGRVELYIPEGSIKENYQIDME